jgi:ATP-dependent DNA helicase RecG
MPSALETLVKILKLEREQGYKNSAVIGGLAAFSEKWSLDAHQQARKPEHHLLVDELSTLLQKYEKLDGKNERHNSVTYMLDRIMNRVPPPPEYQAESQQTETPQVRPSSAEQERRANQPETTKPREEHGSHPRESRHKRDLPQERQRHDNPLGHKQPQERKPHDKPHRQPNNPPKAAEFEEADEVVDASLVEVSDPTREGGGLDPIDDTPVKRSGKSRGGRIIPAGQMDLAPQPKLARPPRKPRAALDPEAAADILWGLSASVSTIKGVGERTERLLKNLEIQTINDMLFFLPRRYDDYTQLSYISRLRPNTIATVIGSVQSATVRAGKNNRKDFVIMLDDGSASMQVVFFGQHFLVKQIRPGSQLVLRGPVGIYGARLEMSNPEWEHLDASNLHTTGIVPVYPLTAGLGVRELRRLMKRTVDYWAERLPDYIPEATLDRCELADLGWAIKNLHFPEGQDHLHHARTRFIFDELLLLQLAILANRRDWQSVPAQALQVTDDFLESFIASVFPYELTNAQKRAIADIRRDVTTAIPMNRLLQGDVGAGKTAVATVAMAMALANRKQAALMAPTSILAEQHYRNISTMLERTPAEQRPVVGLLTSALTNTEREAIYNGLADGSIDVIIGTHALIQESVQFKDLAIAVIDEQHRFGVEQRGALRGKGTNPHLLVMTATPIPRTLALTMYADLDLTILDEKPPGRQPIKTRVVLPQERTRLYDFVEMQLERGRQAFIVHPLVEASEKIEAASAIEAYEDLKGVFHRYKVGLLHGRMKPTEKDEVMSAFSRGEYHILVTTSVAEVGVDIPNASVMVIEGANRFGLSQLHQFRGRVGRGEHTSYCFLISDNDTAESTERLEAMVSTDDGFKLAEIDWKLRGPGDLVGTRQSGRQSMKLVEEMTPHLVELAQREARTIYAEDPYLNKPEHRLLAQRVVQLHHPESDVS